MDRAIATRKDDLAWVKPGAIVLTEPKFLWIKMINRVECHDKALAVRNKFNTILEDILADHYGHYIIDITKNLNAAAYFSNNLLNEHGATCYWIEIDKIVKL